MDAYTQNYKKTAATMNVEPTTQGRTEGEYDVVVDPDQAYGGRVGA